MNEVHVTIRASWRRRERSTVITLPVDKSGYAQHRMLIGGNWVDVVVQVLPHQTKEVTD